MSMQGDGRLKQVGGEEPVNISCVVVEALAGTQINPTSASRWLGLQNIQNSNLRLRKAAPPPSLQQPSGGPGRGGVGSEGGPTADPFPRTIWKFCCVCSRGVR